MLRAEEPAAHEARRVALLHAKGDRAFQKLNCVAYGCEITLHKVVTLAGESQTASLYGSAPPTVVQDSRGRFLVPTGDRRNVAVFSTTGSLISVLKIVDARDRAVVLFANPTGAVLAWTFPSGRAYAIGPDLKVAAWPSSLPYLPSFLRRDGSLIVAQQIQTADLIGYPLHLLGDDGRVVTSFGIDTPEYRADLRLLLDRVAAPANDGSVWAAPPGRHVIEQWNPTTGTKLRRIPIQSDWFVESSSFPRDNLSRPKPIILALWEDNGLVWLLIQDADTAWKPSTESERLLTPELRNSKYDSVLEAVDPSTGKVVAIKRFPFVLFGRAPQLLLASYAFTQSGASRGLDVWKPELLRKEM